MKKQIRILALLAALLFAGCIVTGNVLVVIELEDDDLTEQKDFRMWNVDKDSVQVWKDHYKDIKHIVDLGFSVTIKNNNTVDEARGEFWISKNGNLGSAQEVMQKATKVFAGLVVKPGTTAKITWSQSYQYLHNFDTLKKAALDGQFYLYAIGIGNNLNVSFKKPAVILTVNAKP